MSNLEQQLEKSIQAGKVDLPILPAVSAEVMALTRSEDSDAKELAKLIQSDQSLAGHVMRMANSAAYSSQGNIQTLQQAITKLGMRQVGQMALTVSVGDTVFAADAATQNVIQNLWRHSLASAAWSREIARICRTNTEVAFLCGLLHQIGKPVVVNLAVQISKDTDETQFQVVIDKYSKRVGVELAQSWSLSEVVIDSIQYADDYRAANSSEEEVMTVGAARLLADQTVLNAGSNELLESISQHGIFGELNLYDDDLQVLAEKAPAVSELLNTLAF